MPATPQTAYTYPTQIAAGQALDANPVLRDLQDVASAFNVHTHDAADVSGLVASISAIPAAARVVKGIVGSVGTALAGNGSGYVASRISTGVFLIYFPSAFPTNPVIGANAIDVVNAGVTVFLASVCASSFEAIIGNSSANFNDSFHFKAEQLL